MNFYINNLNEILDNIFKEIQNQKGDSVLISIIDDFLQMRPNINIDNKYLLELSIYPRETIKHCIEKKIVLSLENQYIAFRKSYWEILKDDFPNIDPLFLIHYIDPYLRDLENGIRLYQARTINEINDKYDELISKSFKDFEVAEPIVDNISVNDEKIESNIKEDFEPMKEDVQTLFDEERNEEVRETFNEEIKPIEDINDIKQEKISIEKIPVNNDQTLNNNVIKSNAENGKEDIVVKSSVEKFSSEKLINSGYIEGDIFLAKNYNISDDNQLKELCLIVSCLDNTYDGALTVVSTMCNRADLNDTNPLIEAKSGVYNIDFSKANINEEVINAVKTALNGTRNTSNISFVKTEEVDVNKKMIS